MDVTCHVGPNVLLLEMCLGVSPTHSTTVGRVLNLRTGKITPQYHVAHDELFTTVQGRLQYDALDPATWNELLELGGREHTLDPTDVRGEDVPFSDFYDDFVDLTGCNETEELTTDRWCLIGYIRARFIAREMR